MKKANAERLQSQEKNQYSATKELQMGEESLERYNNFIVSKFFTDVHKHFNLLNVRVCDFGAGVGTLSDLFKSRYQLITVCVELDPKQRTILQSRGFSSYARLQDCPVKFDYIFTSNVLEHIEDDIDALKDIWGALSPQGRLAIYVPALPILFSDLDVKVGHYRRYKKSELIEKVESAGFKVDSCYYNDSLGVLASLLLKIFGFNSDSGLGSRESLKLYDKLVFPFSKFFDKLLMRRIIGKNLFLFAEKL